MSDQVQWDLLTPVYEQQFLIWKNSRGGAFLMREAYRIGSVYARRYLNSGKRKQVSMKLIWELMRDRLEELRTRAKRRGIKITQTAGYSLNNNFHAYVARHIEEYQVPEIVLVGGTSAFYRAAEVIEEYTGIPTRVPPHPALVTPIGMAINNNPEDPV